MTTPDPGLLDEAAKTTTHTEPVKCAGPFWGCGHPVSEHGEDGCLHGWGDKSRPLGGCYCSIPGPADR